MKNLGSWKGLGILCLALFLLIAPQVVAQDDLDDFGGMDDIGDSVAESPDGAKAEAPADAAAATAAPIDNDKPEKEVVDTLTGAKDSKFVGANPSKDPFKPLVKKKVILPPVRRRVRPRTTKSFRPKAPPVKPIKLFVNGIVGNEGNRLAVVKFEGKEETIWKDKVVKGKFKVVDILNDRVVVYSNKEQRRHTFRIGGGKKRR